MPPTIPPPSLRGVLVNRERNIHIRSTHLKSGKGPQHKDFGASILYVRVPLLLCSPGKKKLPHKEFLGWDPNKGTKNQPKVFLHKISPRPQVCKPKPRTFFGGLILYSGGTDFFKVYCRIFSLSASGVQNSSSHGPRHFIHHWRREGGQSVRGNFSLERWWCIKSCCRVLTQIAGHPCHSQSRAHTKGVMQPHATLLASLWGGTPGVTFESLLGHFNSFCVSVEAMSALTEPNRQKSCRKKGFWAQKSQPEIANR